MQNDQIIRQKRERNAKITGIVMSVAVHLCAVVFVSYSGLKYIYPPPQEQAMLIDFSEEEQAPVQEPMGQEPLAEETDPDRPVDAPRVQPDRLPHMAPPALRAGGAF